MSQAGQEKSRGLKFAEQQLLRHGWERGKGLGRAQSGISEAIKVKVKCDKGGVGHREGEQFSFHWWDHVFNKASSSLQVASDQNGVTLKKTEEEEEEEEPGGRMVSNKKPRKAALDKSKLYGCFVKSATLLSGREQPDREDSSSDEETLDLSSTTGLSDSDLMKVCGGRTAHKGARHGLTMSAKLARLEQQEAEFMARYAGKSQSESCSSQEEKPEKKKKKKSAERESPEADGQQKKKKEKKKKKRRDEEEEEVMCLDGGEENTKKKQKKKKNKAEEELRESQPEEKKREPEEEEKKKKKRREPEEEEKKKKREPEEERA
ncbi:G patch domain-containing protein 4 [Salarias fasciatus]|uniref:G patch domain-containing protein 4 n=1 Tax=Salarias fasciatus TaxID=181472 RepID=UPI001176E0D3|nr:G patch domain-containing protein 4 [Salarias fasciatus]